MFGDGAPAVNPSGVTSPSQSNKCSSSSASGQGPLSFTTLWRYTFFRELLPLLVVGVVAGTVLRGPAWQPNYIVLTHPPVARYIIGFGLWVQGWSPDQLNGRYDSLQSRAYNERAGNVPDLDLLGSARNVTYGFAVAAVVLLYGVGRVVGGQVAGLAATVLALVNPLLTTVWTRALAESIVATFALATLLLALLVMPHAAHLGRLAWAPLLIGATLALAVATKLNGALGAVGMGLFATIQQGLALAASRRTAGLRAWVDIAMTAAVLFILVNPLLYVNPVERAVALYQHRQDEMQFQRQVFSDQAVPDAVTPRVARVARRAFDTWATPAFGLPASPDLLLVPLGLMILAWRSAVDLRRGWAGRPLLVLCWTVVTYAIVAANLGFDSSHYFAPPVSLNMVLGGVAAATLLTAPARFARRRWWAR
jgi:4-amino-4-deoxy-L-arabinose transferase-like glycosyltransferase